MKVPSDRVGDIGQDPVGPYIKVGDAFGQYSERYVLWQDILWAIELSPASISS